MCLQPTVATARAPSASLGRWRVNDTLAARAEHAQAPRLGARRCAAKQGVVSSRVLGNRCLGRQPGRTLAGICNCTPAVKGNADRSQCRDHRTRQTQNPKIGRRAPPGRGVALLRFASAASDEGDRQISDDVLSSQAGLMKQRVHSAAAAAPPRGRDAVRRRHRLAAPLRARRLGRAAPRRAARGQAPRGGLWGEQGGAEPLGCGRLAARRRAARGRAGLRGVGTGAGEGAAGGASAARALERAGDRARTRAEAGARQRRLHCRRSRVFQRSEGRRSAPLAGVGGRTSVCEARITAAGAPKSAQGRRHGRCEARFLARAQPAPRC